MTPMISQTTLEIQKTSPENPVYIELQKQHAAYHNMYRTMDTAKLFSLLIFSGIVLFDRIKSNKEKA